jgi:hypothetical protein
MRRNKGRDICILHDFPLVLRSGKMGVARLQSNGYGRSENCMIVETVMDRRVVDE